MSALEFTGLLLLAFVLVCARFGDEDVSTRRRISRMKRDRLVLSTRNRRLP